MSPRDRSAGILVEDGRVLLMHRWKGGDEYFVVPGGQVEDDETPERACVREMREEVGLEVVVGELVREMPDGDRVQRFYQVRRGPGDERRREVRLGDGPEFATPDPDNRYAPEWVPLAQLATVPLRPSAVLPALLALVWSHTEPDPGIVADLAGLDDAQG